ncbi:hypothetical protein BJ170DRAFT_24585 [Xylariales sp. AK1849]|nr:hypothetical protein BJ170DRAFT_24585 [Xylariales sp. AK1849]
MLQLLRSAQIDNASQFSILRQPYSWAHLEVSKDLFESFLKVTNAMDEIRDIVLSFSCKVSHLGRGFTPCAWRQQATVHEISYVFKYPDTKLNDEGDVIWVIRQIGLYHRYELSDQKNTWLMVFPNHQCSSPEEISKLMGQGGHPLCPHVQFLLYRLRSWRWYMDDFEKRYQKSAATVLNVEIEEPLDFTDMYVQLSSLRYVETNISCLLPIFAAYRRVLNRLKQWNETLALTGEADRDAAVEFQTTLESLEAGIEAFETNAMFLLARIASAVQMASDTISLKSQNTTENMSNHMLSDSAAIRVITMVTLVFLPAAFTSGFFGMGFFTTDPDSGGQLIVAPYLWVYFLLAIPMTALTLLYWRWKSRQLRAKYPQQSPL